MSMNKEYLRGHRAEKMIDIDGDFGFDQEEFNRILDPFIIPPERIVREYKEIIYTSSAYGGESSDKA